jgi:hypothetical protein
MVNGKYEGLDVAVCEWGCVMWQAHPTTWSGQWSMANGQWSTVNGQWSMCVCVCECLFMETRKQILIVQLVGYLYQDSEAWVPFRVRVPFRCLRGFVVEPYAGPRKTEDPLSVGGAGGMLPKDSRTTGKPQIWNLTDPRTGRRETQTAHVK